MKHIFIKGIIACILLHLIPTQTFSQTIAGLTYVTPVNIDTYSINTDLSTNNTSYDFKVGSTGSANFAIPIALPIGNAGLTPSLSLVYNSYSGEGMAGQGFNLSCLSSITRAGKEYYNDKTNTAVQLNNNDQFKLDGMRLLKTNTVGNGLQGAEYAKEIEDFSVITCHVNSGSTGPTYFVVTTKEGDKYYYGNYGDTNAYQKSSSNAAIISWYLARHEDTYGNYVQYNYEQDTDNADVWLKSIAYTKNSATTFPKENKVTFTYNRFSNVSTGYLKGCQVKRDKILKEIVVTTGTTTIRKYQLDYITDKEKTGYPRLNKVTEYGKNNEALNPIIINWGKKGNPAMGPDQFNGNGSNIVSMKKVDFNSDGIDDLLIIYKRPIYNGNGTLSDYSDYHCTIDYGSVGGGRAEGMIGGVEYLRNFDVLAGDFNGDKTIDLAIVKDDGKYHIWKGSVNSKGAPVFTDTNLRVPRITVTPSIEHVADFDGDAKDDIYSGTTCYFFNDNLTSYTSMYAPVTTPGYNNDETTIIDFDGDGCTEIVAFDRYRPRIIVNKVSNVAPTVILDKWLHMLSLNIQGNIQFFVGHFNNDRYADVLISNGKGGTGYIGEFTLFTNNGASDFIIKRGVANRTSTKTLFAITDYDKDGVMEMLEFTSYADEGLKNNNITPSIYNVYVSCTKFNGERGVTTNMNYHTLHLSDPINPGPGYVVQPGYYLYNQKVYKYPKSYEMIAGNFTADGRTELLFMNYFTQPDGSTLIKRNILSLSENDRSDLITDIVDGNHSVRSIQYESSLGSKVGKKRYHSVYYTDWSKNPPNMPTVSNIKLTNKSKNIVMEDKSYEYKTPLYRKSGAARFMGFAQEIITDNLYNTVRTNTYNAINAFVYNRSSEEKTNSLSSVLYECVYFSSSYAYGRIYPRLYMTREKSNLTQQDITTIFSNDNHGNIIQKNISYKNGANSTTENHTMTYLTFGRYPSRVATHSVVYKKSNMPDITRNKTYTYNAKGKVSTETNNGHTIEYGYDGTTGLPTSVTKVTGTIRRVTQYAYDAEKKYINKITGPTGLISSFTRDEYGNPLTEKAPGNLTTQYSYDNFGRVIRITAPDGIITTNTYGRTDTESPANTVNYVSVQSNGSFAGAQHLDCFGRTLREISPLLNGKKQYIDYIYNSKGQLLKEETVYPSASTTPTHRITYTYDNYNRVTKLVSSARNAVGSTGFTTTYNYSGPSISTTTVYGNAADTKTSTQVYNCSGLLESETDNSGTTSYTYDAASNLIKTVTGGYAIEAAYNTYGLRTSLKNSDSGTSTYKYNLFDELIEETDAAGNITTYTYNNNGDVVTRKVGGKTTTYTYNATSGLPTKVEMAGHKIEYVYDNLYRVTKETQTIGTEVMAKSYSYDTKGRLATYTSPSGLVQKNVYDAYNDLTEIRNNANNALIWKRNVVDNRGRITQALNGANKQINYTYDNFDNCTRIQVPNAIDFVYTYNDRELLASRNEKYYVNAAWSGFTESFGYDKPERLTSSKIGTSAAKTVTYREGSKIDNKSDIGTYYYSAGKGQIRRIVPASGYTARNQDLTYNATNRVASITENGYTWNYEYDVFNARMKSTLKQSSTLKKTRYYFGDYEKEVNATNGVATHTDYIYAYGDLVAMQKKTGTTATLYYTYTDNLGSIRCITDASGNIVQQLSYDPWGKRRNPTTGAVLTAAQLTSASSISSRGYTLHEHIDEMNLINMNARIYDPELGNFISVDPKAEKYFSSSAYTYCGGNPMNAIDPTGEDWYRNGDGSVWVWKDTQDSDITVTIEGDEGSETIQLFNYGSSYISYLDDGTTLFWDQNKLSSVREPQYFESGEVGFWENISNSNNFFLNLGYNIANDLYIVSQSFTFGMVGEYNTNELTGKRAYKNLDGSSNYKGIDSFISVANSFIHPAGVSRYMNVYQQTIPKGLLNINYVSQGKWYSTGLNFGLKTINSQIAGGKIVKQIKNINSNNSE
ncbi:RHS repeat-associated core domain-containing protein [Bacteroides sp. 519]|uniref:RHS repeat-associated core domain-containing protein n=1 Tax=Bacteroides sp. 519 TaxID=2302937 RepID=UPI0013CF7804|nr:RHS repeat-associated core domain-containing protein [Bacteroides sp. 519]NDV57672.1 hypothetical protein [Bacteroides sp. 519]